jgi:hypothetical protein
MTWTLALSVIRGAWLVAGPLVGVLIGAQLATRNQKRHWVMDNKRAEYRKLLTTLTRTYTTLMNVYSDSTRTGKEELKCERLRLEALNVIRDRIFIAREVREMNLSMKWSTAVGALNVGRDLNALQKAYLEIAKDIQERAAKIID